MTNYKHGNEKQGEFVAVIPDEKITEGSFEATVCLIVDHVLNLSSLEKDFNNDAGGAPEPFQNSASLNIDSRIYSASNLHSI
ncbi:hypothetical protein P886_4468 [Alteromonadaceae bacterium 2753L.S.0a.02]|nr:hypothetical protein P886_4468 [Alteromonadaceae bacterium 2753L.S.0a.02]